MQKIDMKDDNLRAVMQQLRKSGLFCDVTLIAAEDKSRHLVHRCVLYAASDYFRTMFTTNMKEKNAKEIVLKDVDGDTLGRLIDFCYTLEISIDEDNVSATLASAHLYELFQVVNECRQFCQNTLTVSNALSYLTLADTYSLTDLHRTAEKFVFRYFIKITEDASFLRMAADNLANLLSRSEINVESQEDVFDAAVKWIDTDRSERKQHFPKLMDAVRLSEIDAEFILGRVRKCCVEFDMKEYFFELCTRLENSSRTDERKTNSSDIVVVGHPGGILKNQILQYSKANDCWAHIGTFENSDWTHIHNIKQRMCFIISADQQKLKVRRLDLQTMKIISGKSSAHEHSDFASVTLNDDIYVIGGNTTFEKYSTVRDVWTSLASLQQERLCAGASVLNGRIYVSGGRSGSTLTSVERYDPVKEQWKSVASMNVARHEHGSCTIKGAIYVVGGKNISTGSLLASIEEYDEEIDKWTMILFELDVPRCRFGIHAENNRIYIFGGRTIRSVNSNEATSINILNGKIEKFQSMPNRLTRAHCTSTSSQ